eukprot:COSAG06_NODE_6630_length_2849_cov_1.230545_1_plen_99_part_10
MGYWGQARVTGHEATRGIQQDRQIGTFALSRARKLAKRPECTCGRRHNHRVWRSALPLGCSHCGLATSLGGSALGQGARQGAGRRSSSLGRELALQFPC